MGNAVTNPARTFEKKVLGVKDREKSKVVRSGVDNHHFTAATMQHQTTGGHAAGSTAVGVDGGQVSVKSTFNV